MAGTNCASIVAIHILQLLVIYNRRLFAAVLTYDGCMNDTVNSYKVGGWCFYFYHDPSWTSNNFAQSAAQTACLPHGTLAVVVTKKMMTTFTSNYTSAAVPWAWVALNRNASSGSPSTGWYWNPLLPNGRNLTFPAVMSNIQWGSAGAAVDPDNKLGTEYSAVVSNAWGMADVVSPMLNLYSGAQPMAAICQFAPLKWSYLKRGHGRFAVSSYQIAQTNVSKSACVHQCHRSVFCISLAFNPTTNDCQTYAVSPVDPIFAGYVTADSSYDWYIRDGMTY